MMHFNITFVVFYLIMHYTTHCTLSNKPCTTIELTKMSDLPVGVQDLTKLFISNLKSQFTNKLKIDDSIRIEWSRNKYCTVMLCYQTEGINFNLHHKLHFN